MEHKSGRRDLCQGVGGAHSTNVPEKRSHLEGNKTKYNFSIDQYFSIKLHIDIVEYIGKRHAKF